MKFSTAFLQQAHQVHRDLKLSGATGQNLWSIALKAAYAWERLLKSQANGETAFTITKQNGEISDRVAIPYSVKLKSGYQSLAKFYDANAEGQIKSFRLWQLLPADLQPTLVKASKRKSTKVAVDYSAPFFNQSHAA